MLLAQGDLLVHGKCDSLDRWHFLISEHEQENSLGEQRDYGLLLQWTCTSVAMRHPWIRLNRMQPPTRLRYTLKFAQA